MADEAATTDSAGGSKKTVILFAVALLAAIGASAGGTMYFLGAGEAVPEGDAQPAPDKPATAIYHNLRPAFIVNYVTGSKPRLLQVELTVMARDPEVVEALISHMPLIRSQIVAFLTDQDFFELQTHAGKEALRQGLRALIDGTLMAEEQIQGVESVLLTNFVMQ